MARELTPAEAAKIAAESLKKNGSTDIVAEPKPSDVAVLNSAIKILRQAPR